MGCCVGTLRCLRANVQEKDTAWPGPTFSPSRLSISVVSIFHPHPADPLWRKYITFSTMISQDAGLQVAKPTFESVWLEGGIDSLAQSGQG